MDIGYYFRAAKFLFTTAYHSLRSIAILAVTGDKSRYHRHIRAWCKRVLEICQVELEVVGRENLLKGQSVVYVSNHASLMDIPVLIVGLEDRVRIIYKKELEKIPFMGWSMRVSPFIAIERTDPKDAMSGIQEAIEAVRGGDSVIVFAEGTRSKDGKLGEFKRGAFLLASRAEKPIIPVSIIDAQKALPLGTLRFRKAKVKLVIHPAIPPLRNPNRIEEKQLMEKVHAQVASAL